MAGEGGSSVMWLRVEDKDIDAAKLLRVTVNENTTGSGRKRRTSFVCTGTLHKDNEERMGEYDRAQKKIKADPRNDQDLQESERLRLKRRPSLPSSLESRQTLHGQ